MFKTPGLIGDSSARIFELSKRWSWSRQGYSLSNSDATARFSFVGSKRCSEGVSGLPPTGSDGNGSASWEGRFGPMSFGCSVAVLSCGRMSEFAVSPLSGG